MASWKEDRETFAKDLVAELGNTIVPETRLKGYDVTEAQDYLGEAEDALSAGDHDLALVFVARAKHALRSASYIGRSGFEEPAELQGILEACVEDKTTLPEYDMSDYDDAVLGGWLGKCIGGAFGAPVEGWSWERIEKEYGKLSDYITEPDTVNDDTAYEILFLHALEEYGPDLTADQLAMEWVRRLPRAYTAESVAIDNLIAGFVPAESGTHNNPYSEWIGAQMKGEFPGLIAPGRPDIASDYGYLDGIIAHERNGVYGEIYDAVLIALAFVEKDPARLLELGLEYIPQKSRLYKVISDSFEIAEDSRDWRQAREKICESWIYDYHRVHTFPNLAFVVTGLLFGEGDFERTICIVNMCGLDTDCTVGQAAAIMGVILGAEGIPAKWKDPLEDRLDSFVIGFEHLKISQVAELTCQWGRRILEERG